MKKNLSITFLLFLLACGTPYGVYHRVEKGQTLYRISKTYGVKMEDIIKANKLKEPENLKEGQVLFIPGASEVLPVKPYVPEGRGEKIKIRGDEGGKIFSPRNKKVQVDFMWPVVGEITSGFGKRNGRNHDGIDISAPEGTPIRAVEDGRVVYSGNDLRGYGNLIIIKHEGNLFTIYAHNRENLVKKGDFVKKGDIIGKVGKTGRISGPHLHFEVRERKTAVNPLIYLPELE